MVSRCGHSVIILPDVWRFGEARRRQLSALGRAKLRGRMAVGHKLAHVEHWQGANVRSEVAQSLFDVRRCAIVHNLHLAVRLPENKEAA